LQQQQPPQQQKQVGLSQVIKQIAQQVANANPGTNATQIQQVLVQLAKQTAQTASKEQAIQEIQQISSQIAKFPYGTVSQSLAHFAGQLVSASSSGRADTGTTNIMQIAQQIAQEKVSSGGNVSQSVVNKAIQTATGANSNNINQHIKQTAQIISKQTGVPVEKVEAIIIADCSSTRKRYYWTIYISDCKPNSKESKWDIYTTDTTACKTRFR
jgi:uncharacterized protein YyaL (SSP411 family)